MKIKFIYISFALLLFTLFSCIKENDAVKDEGLPVTVACKLSVSNVNLLLTKADTPADENNIANLWVLQFNGLSDGSTLIKAQYYTYPDINNLSLKLITGIGQSIYFIANTSDNTMFNAANAPLSTYKISDLKAKSVAYSSENDNYGASSGNNYLKMSGMYAGNILSGATSVVATLYRLSAKISFNYSSIVSDNPRESGAIVRIKSVQLKNVPASSKLLSNAINTTIAEPASIIDYPATTQGVGLTSGSVVFYMPENIRGIVSGNTTQIQKTANAPLKSTYLEIKGEYYSSEASSYPLKIVTYKIYPGQNLISNYNINSNANHIINITFKGLDVSDSRISVTSLPANSHIVPPGSSVIISVGIKGNGDSNSAELGGVSTTHSAASVGILWQTASKLVKLNNFNSANQTVEVTANPGITAGGNAVIAAYSGTGCTGDILWSWHIWVTNTPAQEDANGYTWMDRNLGASAVANGTSTTFATCGGLGYQWGRKDPFPGSDGLTTGIATSIPVFNFSMPSYSDVNESVIKGPLAENPQDPYVRKAAVSIDEISYSSQLSFSIRYPLLFLQNWGGSTAKVAADYNETGGRDSWGGQNGQSKTIYDPCPTGWRVPSGRKTGDTYSSPWSTWVTGQPVTTSTFAAIKWNNAGVFGTYNWPTPGSRGAGDGWIRSVGTNGGYWSASASEGSATSGHTLSFYNNAVVSNANTDRSYVLYLRCVKE